MQLVPPVLHLIGEDDGSGSTVQRGVPSLFVLALCARDDDGSGPDFVLDVDGLGTCGISKVVCNYLHTKCMA
jgi:hypothetical protein